MSLIEQNVLRAALGFGLHPRIKMNRTDSLLYLLCDAKSALFNSFLNCRGSLESVSEIAKDIPLCSFYGFPSTKPSSFRTILPRYGFQKMGSMDGMKLDAKNIPTKKTNKVCAATNSRDLDTWLEITSATYGIRGEEEKI